MSDLPNLHAKLSQERGFPGGWQERKGYDAYPGATYCRWCGSVDPETFLTILSGIPMARVEIADWKYGWPHKAYIDLANPDPERVTYLGSRHDASDGPYAPGGEKYKPPEPDLVAEADLTDEQKAILDRDGALQQGGPMAPGPPRAGVYYRFGPRVSIRQKFYFEHLLDLPEFTGQHAELIARRTGVRFKVEDGKLGWRGFPPGSN
jgi:hypothetical protein